MEKAVIVILVLISLANFLNRQTPNGQVEATMPEYELYSLSDWRESRERHNLDQREKQIIGGDCPKERCLYIFTKPSCPACRTQRPKMSEVVTEANDMGFEAKIIVGLGTSDEIIKYTETVAGPVLVDPLGEYFDRAGVDFYPQYYLTDADGTVVKRGFLSENISQMIAEEAH